MIDQNVAHKLGGNGEEVNPVIPANGGVSNQSQIGFVHQRRALQGVILALPGQAVPGEAAKFIVDEGDEFFARRAVPVAPAEQ
jgi:hypothetical protein